MAGKHHDLINFTKKYKGGLHEFFLDAESWKTFKTRHKLSWQKERFAEAHHSVIPKERGIYAFTFELTPNQLPLHGYILYIGITGDTSAANLYKRYAQYLRHLKNEDGRPAIFYMLKNWADDLFFNFVTLPKTSVSLETLERQLLTAIIPPVNKKDLGADIVSIKAAKF